MDNDWVVVYSTDKQYVAEMINSLLESANLNSVIMNKKDSSYNFGEFEILVQAANVDQARSIIETKE
ncbi:MAG: DUF2007 domain-containing protein [Salinivirgaceae bacterium]|nr:DUF2007 domain-containing protein [Salinivirgaceae bacterium]